MVVYLFVFVCFSFKHLFTFLFYLVCNHYDIVHCDTQLH